MASCPSCGAEMGRRPSWSGNPRMSWDRCPSCGRMEMVVDGSLPPAGRLEHAEYDFGRLRERARGGNPE